MWLSVLIFAQAPAIPPAPSGDTYVSSLLGWVLTAVVGLVVVLGGGIWALIMWFMSSLEKQRADSIAAQERMQAKHDLQMKESNDKHDADMKDKREKHDAVEAQTRKDFLDALKEQKDACQKELAASNLAWEKRFSESNAASEARMKMVMEQMMGWRAESLAEAKQMRETSQLMITKMAEMELRRQMAESAEGSKARPKGGG